MLFVAYLIKHRILIKSANTPKPKKAILYPRNNFIEEVLNIYNGQAKRYVRADFVHCKNEQINNISVTLQVV